MRFSLTCIAFVALLGGAAFAAPIAARQGAGVGAACNYIVSDADTMLGEASRGAGKTIAGMLSGENARALMARQGAGVGAGCDSIVSDADTMLGTASRGAGKTLAQDLSGGANNANAARQLNGIADGLTAITADIPGAESSSEELDTFLNNVDGDGTNGSAELGKNIGDAEVSIGDAIGGKNGESGGGTGGGAAPAPGPGPAGPGGPGPKRQLNGIADGVSAITADVPGLQGFSSQNDAFLNTVDGQGTNDSAELGEMVGDEEVRIGQSVGGKNGQSGGTK